MDSETEKGVSVYFEGAPTNRIVNGTNAAPGQFPFQVSTAVRLNVLIAGEHCSKAQCTDCW
jgi:secreted trypsin-like serine protease